MSILEPRSPVTTANVGGSGADRPGPDFFVVSTSADRVPESRHPCGWT